MDVLAYRGRESEQNRSDTTRRWHGLSSRLAVSRVARTFASSSCQECCWRLPLAAWMSQIRFPLAPQFAGLTYGAETGLSASILLHSNGSRLVSKRGLRDVSAARNRTRSDLSQSLYLPVYSDDLLCFLAIVALSILTLGLLTDPYSIFLLAVINSSETRRAWPQRDPADARLRLGRPLPAAWSRVQAHSGRGASPIDIEAMPAEDRPRRAGVGKRATADTRQSLARILSMQP